MKYGKGLKKKKNNNNNNINNSSKKTKIPPVRPRFRFDNFCVTRGDDFDNVKGHWNKQFRALHACRERGTKKEKKKNNIWNK